MIQHLRQPHRHGPCRVEVSHHVLLLAGFRGLLHLLLVAGDSRSDFGRTYVLYVLNLLCLADRVLTDMQQYLKTRICKIDRSLLLRNNSTVMQFRFTTRPRDARARQSRSLSRRPERLAAKRMFFEKPDRYVTTLAAEVHLADVRLANCILNYLHWGLQCPLRAQARTMWLR